MSSLIQGTSFKKILAALHKDGFISLQLAGLQKIMRQETNMTELERVLSYA
jgi:hypothetical protein